MTDEEWDELLKLRGKASLSPQADQRFTLLEIYLSAVYTLSTFSQEEQGRLNTQFKELPDEDKQAVLSRVLNKTHPNLFHLTSEEVDKLKTARRDLPLYERARLSDIFIHTAAGLAWIDLGEVFKAQIEIDDHSSPERESRPYAHISYFPGFKSRVETYDILESVRQNPVAIGHPVIAFAISHWQRVLHAKRVLERDDVTSRGEIGQTVKYVFGGVREVRVAERNLEEISKALVEGAKNKALSKEAAFAVKVELMGLGSESKESLLYRAWDKLKADSLAPTDDVGQILTKIEADLDNDPFKNINSNPRHTSVDRVMEFLKDEGKNGGKKYVGYNEKGNLLRPNWITFRNAFLAWYFNLGRGTVQQYLEEAAKQQVDVNEVFQPSWSSPKTTLPRVWSHLLVHPLVKVCEPVALAEEEVEIHGVENAIENVTLDDEDGSQGN
ncbi:MAG TPA: hypothetical protein VGC87_03465 [Pyrinomonadaceae bacterium]